MNEPLRYYVEIAGFSVSVYKIVTIKYQRNLSCTLSSGCTTSITWEDSLTLTVL